MELIVLPFRKGLQHGVQAVKTLRHKTHCVAIALLTLEKVKWEDE